MIESRERTINGHTYIVTQLTARKAIKTKAKLFKLFGPTLARMTSLIKPEKKQKPKEDQEESKEQSFFDDRSSEQFAAIAMQLTHNLDEQLLDDLINDLLTGLRRDGVEMPIQLVDVEFAGDLMTLYKVLFFAIEVNFADFLPSGGIGSLLNGLKPQ